MKDRHNGRKIIILIAIFLAFCSSTTKPVALHPEDMCSFCKMAISQKQFASEIISTDGDVFKFDDIGCMLNYIKKRQMKGKIAASYVMDFEKTNWILAEQASFVATNEIQTPMSGGYLAFHNNKEAHLASQRFKGRLLTYSQLLLEKES
jgi:copper chaperone NosL